MGGICGINSGITNSCFLYCSNVIGKGNADVYIGGICGSTGVSPYYHNEVNIPSLSSCYVYEDSSHRISKDGNNGYSGILVGHLYNSLALYGEYGRITDCFYSNDLPTGIELIGLHGDINSPNAVYEERGITNCYYSIKDYMTFKEQIWTTEKNTFSINDHTWSCEAWINYNISESNWPPTLKEQ